jgi:hypothetical protein
MLRGELVFKKYLKDENNDTDRENHKKHKPVFQAYAIQSRNGRERNGRQESSPTTLWALLEKFVIFIANLDHTTI